MSRPTNLLFKSSAEDRKKAIDKIINSSSPRRLFFLMIALSAVITTLGLLSDNVAVIIGGMLVAPILSPFLSLALGVVLADFSLVNRSVWVIFKTLITILFFSFAISIFVPFTDLTGTLIEKIQPTLPYLYIALAAGIAASFAIVRSELAEFLPGTIIAVALLPSLCNISIGFRMWNWVIVVNSLELFLINLIGIVLASVVVFSLMGFYSQRKEADKAITQEQKELEEE